MLISLNTILQSILGWAGRIAGWLLLALILTILADVIGRNAFSSGSTQLQELEWHLNATIFMLAIGYAYGRGAHVRIELISQRFSNRQRAIIEIIGILALLLPYCVALTLYGVDYVSSSFAFNESSASATGLPYRWVLKGIMVFGFILMGLAGISQLIDRILVLADKKPPTVSPTEART